MTSNRSRKIMYLVSRRANNTMNKCIVVTNTDVGDKILMTFYCSNKLRGYIPPMDYHNAKHITSATIISQFINTIDPEDIIETN